MADRVKQSLIHWLGGLTGYVEVVWGTTNELGVGA